MEAQGSGLTSRRRRSPAGLAIAPSSRWDLGRFDACDRAFRVRLERRRWGLPRDGGVLPTWIVSRWSTGCPPGCGIGAHGPQKGNAREDPSNVPGRFEKPRRLHALWGSEHPVRWQSSVERLASRILSREVEPHEFRCVRIITRETASQGPQVALLGDRRYR